VAQSLSPAVDLAWKIAIAESASADHPEILAEDIVIGICKLPSFDQEQVPASARAAVAAEVNKLSRLFSQFGIDPQAFYPKLRQRIHVPIPPEPPKHMQRSPAARAAFNRAAEDAGTGSITSLHLLAALIEPPDAPASKLLAEMGISAEAVRSAALKAAGVAPKAEPERPRAVEPEPPRSPEPKRAEAPEPEPVRAVEPRPPHTVDTSSPPAPEPRPAPAVEPEPARAVEMTADRGVEMSGSIAAAIDARVQPFASHPGGVHADELRRGIQLVIELARDFALAGSTDDLLARIQKQLESAFTAATSGAVTLMDADRLLLKAHWPRGMPRLSSTLARQAATQQRAFLWRQGESNSPLSMVGIGEACAMYAPMVDGTQVVGVLYIGSQAGPKAFGVDDLELLRAAAGQAGTAMRALRLQAEVRQLDSMRSSLLRQFSPRVAEKLSRESGRVRLGGERISPVTVLMSDVRGFTAASETMDPADVVDMLNEMFAAFVPTLFHHDATVDRFIGDAVLAVFGSPEPDEDQWEKAVKAALEMQASINRLREAWHARGLKSYQVGIGIHTGPALQGFIGSPERMDYTVIGATVNRASRHCDAAGPGEVLISKEVYERVYRQVVVEPRTVVSKHPETEPTLEAYVVTGLRS
jgi:class 3 adenylate cyclase